MTKEQTLEDEFKPAGLPRLYSQKQLEEFEKRLKEFLVEKDVTVLGDRTTKEKVMVFDIWGALEVFGAARKNKPVVYNGISHTGYSIIMKDTGGDRHGKKTYETPSRYDIFMDKYDQLQKLKGRKAFGEEARLGDYEKMAEEIAGSMRYTPNVDD